MHNRYDWQAILFHRPKSRSTKTVTVPCWIPVSIVRWKIALTSSGFAEVVISQSFGCLPSRLSRTQPPTIYASYPCLFNCCKIYAAPVGISIFMYFTQINNYPADVSRVNVLIFIFSMPFQNKPCVSQACHNVHIHHQAFPVQTGYISLLHLSRP